jgi:DivIVA domain-containing protein
MVRYACAQVELDRESIERRDFPVARRGYDPAAVDAHLRALAAAVQALEQQAQGSGELALGSTTATQVQGILDAAQATAAEIERQAQRDAQRTREEAAGEVERARTHVEALARASTALLARLESLDGEVGALAENLRAGGFSPGGEGAHDGEREGRPVGQNLAPSVPALAVPAPAVPAPAVPATVVPAPAVPAPTVSAPTVPVTVVPAIAVPAPVASAATPRVEESGQGGEDLDGARLVALNMALGGEPREQTDRYLAESFKLVDRAKLLDEVYAAIEG